MELVLVVVCFNLHPTLWTIPVPLHVYLSSVVFLRVPSVISSATSTLWKPLCAIVFGCLWAHAGLDGVNLLSAAQLMITTFRCAPWSWGNRVQRLRGSQDDARIINGTCLSHQHNCLCLLEHIKHSFLSFKLSLPATREKKWQCLKMNPTIRLKGTYLNQIIIL